MSTDAGTRRAHTRRRRSRAFLVAFAAVIAVLGIVGLAGAAVTTAQGPRVTRVSVDPDAAVSAAGSDRTSVRTAVRLSTVRSSSAMTRAAPASDRARAFRVWWSSMAIFSGIKTDGRAVTASSEQVRRPIFTDGIEQWKHYEAWLGPLEAALGPVLGDYPVH